METIATSSYLPPLAKPHERDGVGQALGAVLLDLVALSLTGKQLHWTVTGPHARSLHLQLDELVDSWRELADTVAERAIVLGHVVDGQASAVASGSDVAPVPVGPIEDHVLVHEVTHRVAAVAERTRARMEPLGDVDLVSQDVLLDVVRELEKQQWLLRVQFGGRS